MKIFPLTSVLGAEIFGADVTEESSFLSIFEAFVEYGVIAIRDQHITPEEQIRFAKRFSKININRFFASHPQHPEIAMLVKEPHQRVAIGEGWHTDHFLRSDSLQMLNPPYLLRLLRLVETRAFHPCPPPLLLFRTA